MDPFTLEVEYKGSTLELPGRVLVTGYTHKIIIDINGIEVTFEPDEERNYRAVVEPQHVDAVDKRLLVVVAEELERALKG